jgi:hypothetical protein
MTYRAHPTTRRPSRPLCPSSGDDPASRRPHAGGRDRDRCGRDLPGLAGRSRWAIRWAKPCRIGPYQAQRRAPNRATVWADLQAFRRLKAPRTPCFTRERTVVRNHPRPSKTQSFAGTSVASPCATAMPETRRYDSHRSNRLLPTAERTGRAPSRLTRENSPVRRGAGVFEPAVSRSLRIGALKVEDAVLERLAGGRNHGRDERAASGWAA